MIAKQPKSDRKSRTKLRKPKFLSLRLQLNATPPPPVPPMSPTTTATDVNKQQQQLINLFPLHPEKLADDEHNMAACIFSSCDDVDRAATTLTGILRSDDEDDEENGNRNGNENRNTDNPSPSSVNYADEEVELVRTAMRRNVSDKTDDEKWVCYSEVVERKKEIISSSSSSTTTTSNWYTNVNGNGNGNGNHRNRSKLVLKLDYDKVMECWVNKGPLYIHGDGSGNSDAPQPQTVPDLHDDHDFFWGTRHDEQDNGGNAGSWTVPEMTHIESSGMSRGDDALQAGDSSAMMHNREASVQRYKEKRRNRLFAKTIRYEVRKLNAEKRPRIKGRFVKRN